MDMVYYPEDPRYYLKNELEARLKRRPHYSLRAFARDLELSPSTISDFLNGKMGFSKDRVFELSKKLGLSFEQRDHWWDLLEAKYARHNENRRIAKIRANSRSQESKNRLTLEHFQYISEWQHLAILELVEISNQYHSAEALAKALGVGIKIIRESLDRLEKLGLLIFSPDEWRTSTGSTLVGGATVPSKAIRSFHTQMLEKAAEALETQAVETRESRSIVFKLPADKVPEIKEELNKALTSILMRYSHMENLDSVYCLSTHLFSLTHKEP